VKSVLLHTMFLTWIHLLFSGCTSQQSKQEVDHSTMKYFEWQPGVNAPAEYPSRIYRAYFYNNNDIMGIPSGGICDVGWGEKWYEYDDKPPDTERLKNYLFVFC